MNKQLILALTFPAFVTSIQAAPTGKIGFLGAKGAQIWNLSTQKTVTLPGALKATDLTLSPQGEAIFFIPSGKKVSSTDSTSLNNGYISHPPYRRIAAIPALQAIAPYSYTWSSTGHSLYVSGENLNGVLTPATGKWKKLGIQTGAFDNMDSPSTDRAGKLLGYSTESEVIVRDIKTGKNRVLFSTKYPAPIFEALKHCKNPKKVSDLLEGEEMSKEPYGGWQLAGPELSPDGKLAYFASNCGTGYGAAGNGMQGYFTVNLKTGKISVMSKIGSDFGRPPSLDISPDGKRLLSVISVHDSAADNSTVVSIIDLETQNTREIMYKIPGSKDHANFYGGSAWSPDSNYVALSGYFYDPEKMMENLDNNFDNPPSSAWKTAIFEAATGKTWGIKQGMRSPSWSR